MIIQLKVRGKTLIAIISGELDHHSAIKVKEILEAAIVNKTVKNLIFDFSALTFMDSSGIGVIIGRYKLITALGGNVKIVCTNGRIDKLMTMSGLKRIISVESSIDSALKSL